MLRQSAVYWVIWCILLEWNAPGWLILKSSVVKEWWKKTLLVSEMEHENVFSQAVGGAQLRALALLSKAITFPLHIWMEYDCAYGFFLFYIWLLWESCLHFFACLAFFWRTSLSPNLAFSPFSLYYIFFIYF